MQLGCVGRRCVRRPGQEGEDAFHVVAAVERCRIFGQQLRHQVQVLVDLHLMRQVLGLRRPQVHVDELLAVFHGLLVDRGCHPDTFTATLAVLAIVQVEVQVATFDRRAELLVGFAGGGHDHSVPLRRQLHRDDEALGQQDTVGHFPLRGRCGRTTQRRGGARHQATGRLRVIQKRRNGHRRISVLWKGLCYL